MESAAAAQAANADRADRIRAAPAPPRNAVPVRRVAQARARRVPDDGPQRPRREPGPPAERPARPAPAGAAPATPSRPAQQAPAERAQPPAATPASPQRPAAQERERLPPAEPLPSRQRPRRLRRPARPRLRPAAAQPATPPAPAQQQRPAPDTTRPVEPERPGRSDSTGESRQDARTSRPTPLQLRSRPHRPAPPAAAQHRSARQRPAPAAPPATRAQPCLPHPRLRCSTGARTDCPSAGSSQRDATVGCFTRPDRGSAQPAPRAAGGQPGHHRGARQPHIIREGNEVIIRHDETERFRRTYRDADVRVERRGGERGSHHRAPSGRIRDRDGAGRVRQPGPPLTARARRPRGRADREPPRGDRRPRLRVCGGGDRATAAAGRPHSARGIHRRDRSAPRRPISSRLSPRRRWSASSGPIPSTRFAAASRCASACAGSTSIPITFEFGSWELPGDQVGALRVIAEAIRAGPVPQPERDLPDRRPHRCGRRGRGQPDSLRPASGNRCDDPHRTLPDPGREPDDPGLWRAVPEGELASPRAAEPPGDHAPDHPAASGTEPAVRRKDREAL